MTMITRLIAILLCLLTASPAWAAITAVGTLGSVADSTSGTSIVLTTSATLEAGNEGFVFVGADNVATTPSNTNNLTDCADSTGSNTYEKIYEYTFSEGAGADGTVGAIFKTRAAAQLTSGGTITCNFSTSIAKSVLIAWEFIATNALTEVGTRQTADVNSADPPSMTINDAPNAETLFIRIEVEEQEEAGGFTTPTTNWTTIGGIASTGGVGTANVNIKGEFLILTGTTATSNPADNNDGDAMGLMVAFQESAAAVVPTAPIFFQ